jgi:hypothetical protein
MSDTKIEKDKKNLLSRQQQEKKLGKRYLKPVSITESMKI